MRFLFILCIWGNLWGQIQVIPQGKNAFNQAMMMERAGNMADAILIYHKILEGNPSHQPAYFQLKNIYTKTGNPKSAIQLVESWLKHNPSDLQSELALGEFYFRDQKQDKALSIWNQFRKNRLTNQTTYRLLFHTYARFGQVQAMEFLVREGREKFNEPHLFAIDLANYYQSRQTFNRSLREYMTLIRHQKQYLQYTTDRILLMSDDTTTHALIDSTLNASASVNPDVRSILAGFYYKTGQFEQAFSQHQKIGLSNQNDTDRWMAFAENLRKEGQHDLSIQSFHFLLQESTQSDPNTVGKALLGLGQAYEDQIIYDQTELKFVKWFPENDFFKNQFVKAPSIGNEELANTLSHYQSVLSLLPPSQTTATVHFRLGEIQARMMRDHEGARSSYTSAIDARPKHKLNESIRLRLGDLYLSSGQFDEAIVYFRQDKSHRVDDRTIRYLNAHLYSGSLETPMAFLDSVTLALNPDHRFFNDLLEIHDLMVNYYADGTRSDRQAFATFFEAEGLIRQFKIPEGLGMFQSLRNDHPDALITPLATLRLALLLIEFGQLDQALRVAISIENSPLKDQGLVLAGEIEEQFLGNTQNALSYYHRLLSECPSSLLVGPVRLHIRKLSQPQES